jgi:hypothetical protein
VLLTPDLVPAYTLTQLPDQLLVEEKLKALLSRGKPRDFFDLYFMLRKGLVQPEAMSHLRRAKDALLASKIDFGKDLTPFLPRAYALIVKDFRKTLLDELASHGL